MFRAMLAISICLLGACSLIAGTEDGHLDIYFVDVEGGAATVIVTPDGESLLIDSGYPDNGGRDRDRILNVIQNVAKLDHLDHAIVSHWHLDHFGNHAALAAKLKIHNFWDRGIPEALSEDPGFANRIGPYRSASQNQSRKLQPGDFIPLKASTIPIDVKILTASGDVIPNDGPPNPFAADFKPQPEDTSDNAKSISLLLTFGKFRFVCCGDLTWNTEAKLMSPNNPVGPVDLFMATHHGLNVSNNPVMVLALDPHVCVTCNGPTKGADPETIATFKQIKSLQAMYQLHRNVRLKESEQSPAGNIANPAETANCKGVWIKASVDKTGERYTIQVGPQGTPREFLTR